MSTKVIKDTVMSFRIPSEHAGQLDEELTQHPIVGVGSPNKFCRKLVLDYLSGKLAYSDAEDRDFDAVITPAPAPGEEDAENQA